MYDPSKILTWLEENVQSMRRSRMKTLPAAKAAEQCARQMVKRMCPPDRVVTPAPIGNYLTQLPLSSLEIAFTPLEALPT